MKEDIVTSVTADKRGAKVLVNEDETLWINRDAWMERELTPGESINLEETKQWLLPRQYSEALNAAISMLATQARSTAEIRKKLKQKPYMDETIEMVLYKLEKEKLTDDDAYARTMAAALSRRHMGRQRIQQALWQKGINREAAERAISELDEDELDEAAVEAAQKLLKRYLREEDSRKAMNKLMMAMARRGYEFDTAKSAVEEALRREEEEP
ncbi:MAG: regulatory protein RecX [Eubacteriales bacterium]|nr:regulatory protein RecX [Eubacteriales bacterium]